MKNILTIALSCLLFTSCKPTVKPQIKWEEEYVGFKIKPYSDSVSKNLDKYYFDEINQKGTIWKTDLGYIDTTKEYEKSQITFTNFLSEINDSFFTVERWVFSTSRENLLVLECKFKSDTMPTFSKPFYTEIPCSVGKNLPGLTIKIEKYNIGILITTTNYFYSESVYGKIIPTDTVTNKFLALPKFKNL